MDRRTIGLIWLGGIVLMAVLYAVGPQHFVDACADVLSRGVALFGDLIDTLMWRAFDMVCAAAIALYAVFVLLAVIALRRGLRAGGTLIIVSVLFLLLVRTHWYDPGTKWLTAAVLSGVAAGMMTKRLIRSAPFRRDPANPWGKTVGDGIDNPDPHRAP